MSGRVAIGVIALYYCAAMLTGTYWYQHRRDHSLHIEEVRAVMAGAMWPVYWTGRAAMKITE